MGQSVAVLSQYFILTGEERVKILQRKLLSYLEGRLALKQLGEREQCCDSELLFYSVIILISK